MNLKDLYKGIVDKDGKTFHLVDTNELKILFSTMSDKVKLGKKFKETFVYIAQKGEIISTEHNSVEEARYEAKGGEIVFDNGGGDKFVPRDNAGESNGKIILNEKYQLVSGSLEEGNAKFIPSSPPSKILVGINKDYIRILNPWGENSTQDLPPNSVLKLNGEKVTGIEKDAFEKTWKITDKLGNPLSSDDIDKKFRNR